MREDSRWTVVPMRVTSGTTTASKHSTHRPNLHPRHHHQHHHHRSHQHHHHQHESLQSSRRKCPIHDEKRVAEQSDVGSSRGSSDWEYEYPDEREIIEEKVHISLKSGQSLGCSVVRGPTSYPGIFVQEVKWESASAAAGLQVGDQILGMNGFSFFPGHYNFDDAIRKIKACTQMSLTVRKGVGLHLFRHKTDSECSDYDPEKDFDLTGIPDADLMTKVRMEEQRLAQDRRLLAEQQLRLQQEMQRLAIERKELEALRLQAKSEDGGSSISSSDMMSILSSSSSPDPLTLASSSSPALGFLDELKQLAEKRSSDDSGLLLDTLKKTSDRKDEASPGPRIRLKNQITHPSDDQENRKRHELLMQEFKNAHHKMFAKSGLTSSGTQVTDSSHDANDAVVSNPGHEHQDKETPDTTHVTRGVNAVTSSPPVVPLFSPTTGVPTDDSSVSQSPAETQKVLILKTWSPLHPHTNHNNNKKQLPPPPPPPPLPVSRPQPLVTVTSYQTKTQPLPNIKFLKSSSRDA